MLNIKKSTIQTKGRREFSYNTPEKNRFVGSSEVNIISGASYHAGQNIQITADNVISAVDTKYVAGHNIEITSGNVINALAEKYYAGDNISISSGNVISTSANVHSDTVLKIVTLTQEQYDGMYHDSDTLYLIVPATLNVSPNTLNFDADLPIGSQIIITSNSSWEITIEEN